MTVAVTLNATSWTLISNAAAGFMENQAGCVIIFRVEDAPPGNAENMGHYLKFSDSTGWSRAVAKNIYGRLMYGEGDVIVTEG